MMLFDVGLVSGLRRTAKYLSTVFGTAYLWSLVALQ